jgi:hypothetical protein
MFRIKYGVLSLLAALTLSALASSTALAATHESGFEEALIGPSLSSLPASPAPGSSLFEKEVAVLASKGIHYARALQALDVQNKVAQTDIVRKVEDNMAGTSGGVWFEPTTAQLHIGVTSPDGRRAAEKVIAREGLTANVVFTPVRSTMAELLATQGQWSRKLASLSAGPGVSTAIEPQHNAVVVRLDSSVSPSDVAVLREASAADVNVLVSVVPGRLDVVPMAKTECKTWKTFEGYCNPSITSGVTIVGRVKKCVNVGKVEKGTVFFATQKECEERVKPGKEGEWGRSVPICSAGPLAIKNKKERVMLTAGHCISEKTEKEAWWGITKAEKETKIGVTGTFAAGGPNAEKRAGDYAEAGIEPAWQTGKEKPSVFAVTARWKKMNAKKEETSYPVIGENVPLAKTVSCHVGQTTGESCGEVKALNVETSYKVNGEERFFTGLVEVIESAKETLEIKGGDSGGPELKESTEALMEGMAVAAAAECKEVAKEPVGLRFYKTEAECKNKENPGKGNWEERIVFMLFQPLKKVTEAGPKGALEQLGLELLTKANE